MTARSPRMPGGSGYRLARLWRIGYADNDFPRNCLLRLLDYPDLLLRTGMRETLKAGRTALVVRAEVPAYGRMLSIAYKRVRRRTWLKTLTSFLPPQRTLRTWRLGHELLARGIPTPRPLAAIVPRWFSPSRESWLATEWVDGQGLSGFLDDFPAAPAGPREQGRASAAAGGACHAQSALLNGRRVLQSAADCLGDLVGRMHAAGVAHRDLKASNLMIAVRQGGMRAWVIDLDGVSLRSRLSGERRARNLARLAAGLAHRREITHTVRLRFLRSYLLAAGEDTRQWKACWSRVLERSRRLATSR